MAPPALTPVDESIVARHSPYGVSTGFMWDERGDWEAQIALASRVSISAIELSALAEDEVEPLLRFLHNAPSLPFRFRSIHGPAKNRRLDEIELVELLSELGTFAMALTSPRGLVQLLCRDRAAVVRV